MFELLVVGVRWPPETFIQRKLEGLAKAGIRVTVATTTPQRQVTSKLPGIHVLKLPHWQDPAILQLLQTMRAAVRGAFRNRQGMLRAGRLAIRAEGNAKRRFALLRLYLPLATMRPDVVHFEWNSAAIDFQPLYEVWKVPVVISCRGSQINVRPHLPDQEQFVQGLRRTFNSASAVHCVSEAILHEARRYGLDHAKAWVIRPAVDDDFFRPPSGAIRWSDDGTLRAVTAGSLVWQKGYEYALLAVRHLIDAGVQVRLDIIGDGPERQRVLFTVHDLGLERHARILGRLTPKQVRDTLQQSDVFLLASLSEGICNAVLEAMACGLPVVTTDCGGMREAVSDGVEGFVVPVRDPQAMALALQRLAENPLLRRQMGEAGRQRILQQFTLEQQVQQFIALYESVRTE